MIKADRYYLENLQEIYYRGILDRNPRPKYADGTPAHSKFITQVVESYDLSKGEFPITTLRNTAIKTGIKEILWIYQKQSSSLKDAHALGIKWWDSWDIGDGTIGQRYGATVKRYDLMNKLLNGLKNDPFSRRHIIDLYQEQDLQETKGLYPCAFQTLWSVREVNGEMFLDCSLVLRSSDFIVANYINKSQYSALQMMVAGHLTNETGKTWKPGKFLVLIQNCHIYTRHFDAVEELLNRTPIDIQPKIILKENKNFYDYTIDDFQVENTELIEKLDFELELAI